jgi:two-component system sensor histidine kinase GraS
MIYASKLLVLYFRQDAYKISLVYSILYIIILNIGLSVLFLIFTYLKEVKFYKHLDENIEPEALKHLLMCN